MNSELLRVLLDTWAGYSSVMCGFACLLEVLCYLADDNRRKSAFGVLGVLVMLGFASIMIRVGITSLQDARSRAEQYKGQYDYAQAEPQT